MFGFLRRSRERERISIVPNFEASAEERERMSAAEKELRAIARDIAQVRLDRPVIKPRKP